MKIIYIILIMALSIFSIAGFAYSQQPPSSTSVESATREVDRLGRDEEDMTRKMGKRPEGPAKIKIEKPEVKKEGPKFFVKKIELAGTERVGSEAFRPMIEKYENRDVTLDEIKALTKDIEREYIKRGFIAACFIPPQDVREGHLMLQVIEAKMGDLQVETEGSWYANKDIVSAYWTIQPGEVLSYERLARSLYLMNKNPDKQVRSTLHAGKKPETTDILLNVDQKMPVHFTASFDREGATTTGRERKGIGIKNNSLSLVDDIFIYGYTYGERFSGTYFYHKIPFTNSGTSFMYGYNASKSFPGLDYFASGIDARSQSGNFMIYQDLFDKADYLGELYTGVDMKDKSIKYNTFSNSATTSGTTTRDRLRLLKMGGNFTFRSPISVTYISPELTQGLKWFGTSGRTELSSRLAWNTFTKFTFDARHFTVWPLDIQTNLNFRSQWASEKLMPQDEFDLGGIDSVRGYAWGDFQGDNGIQANLDVLIPAFFIPKDIKIPYICTRPLKDYFTGIVFLDYGYGQKVGLRGDQSEIFKGQLVGVGAGLRVRLLNQGSMRLEWGFPIGDTPRTEGAGSKGRFHFTIDFEDRIYEEAERIGKLLKEDNIRTLAWNILNSELNRIGSPIKTRFDYYRYIAGRAYKNGDYEKAKKYYEKIAATGSALYEQTESYVRAYIERRKELKKDNEIALKYYKSGEIGKAKEIWQKVVDDARTKSLTLEY